METFIYNIFRHEIAGVVTEVGSNVTQFKVGDHVGVGTYVNTCRDCEHCNEFLEVHCKKGVYTFNGIDYDGTVTRGGYSNHIVVRDRYGNFLFFCFNFNLYVLTKNDHKTGQHSNLTAH